MAAAPAQCGRIGGNRRLPIDGSIRRTLHAGGGIHAVDGVPIVVRDESIHARGGAIEGYVQGSVESFDEGVELRLGRRRGFGDRRRGRRWWYHHYGRWRRWWHQGLLINRVELLLHGVHALHHLAHLLLQRLVLLRIVGQGSALNEKVRGTCCKRDQH